MTLNNRETMQRAVGIIEGASFVASTKVQDALTLACDLLDSVIDDTDITTSKCAKCGEFFEDSTEYAYRDAYGRGYCSWSCFIHKNEIVELTDDLILALTAVLWWCLQLNGDELSAKTYYVNNTLLGDKEIKLSEAVWQLDKWLKTIGDKRLAEKGGEQK